jgi:hypothetical protein
MIFVLTGIGVFLIAIGFTVTEKNARHLLAGYNTMSDEERKRFDIKGYIRYFRKFHMVLGASLVVTGIALYYTAGQNSAGIFLATYPILAYIYFLWSSNRYSREAGAGGNMFAAYILGGALVIVVVLLMLGFKEDQLTVSNDAIEISGMYGEQLTSTEVQSVELADRIPEIKMKANGFALGTINKGYFKTVDGELVKLILNSRTMPCILITRSDGKKIYYSSKTIPNAQLFESLKRVIPAR